MILDSNENKFIELISDVPNVAVQGYDKERNVIYWNNASEDIYGYTKEEALGKKFEDLIIPDFMRNDVIQQHTNWHTKNISIPPSKLSLLHKNGSTVFVYSSHVMLGVDRGTPEMFCVDIDLTKQHEQEENLKQKDLLLTQQSKMAQMGEMLSMIAHQWQQPLGAISSTSADLQLKILLEPLESKSKEEINKFTDYFESQLKNIDDFIGTLTTTLSDFRNFFNPNKQAVVIKLEDVLCQSLKIIILKFSKNITQMKQ